MSTVNKNTEFSVIKNKAGEVIDITQGRQLIALFLEKVPDPVTRSILFKTCVDETNIEELIDGVESELGESAGIISVMRRIINYVFVTALCRWKQLDDDTSSWAGEEDVEYFRNSRFTKLFRSAIGKEDVTLDLQIFALMELWVNLKKADENVRGRFENIFATTRPVDNIGLTLQDVRDAIKNASFKTMDAGKYTIDYCSRLCYKLLCSFPFLRVVKTTFPLGCEIDEKDKKDISISYELNFDENVTLYPNEFYDNVRFVVTNWQLRTLAGEGKPRGRQTVVRLFLMAETSAFNGRYQYTYRSFDGESETRIEPKVEAEEEQSVEEIQNSQELSEVRKFLAFNYKNIRELALVICDAIKDQTSVKDRIFRSCRDRGSKIIPTEVQSADSKSIYWDNVITLLLVERGPSDFLELLFKDANDMMFAAILKNIGWRCIGSEAALKIKKDYEEQAKQIADKCGRKEKAKAEQIRALRVRKVLEAMNFVKDVNNGLLPFEESLSYKYENIYVCVNSLKENRKEKQVYSDDCDNDRYELIEIYKNIFKFLQIFYAGMNSYAECVINGKNTALNVNTADATKGPKERPEWYAFAESAARKKLEIENQTLSQVFEGFCKLCSEYNTTTGLDANASDKAKNLKFLITRNYICDVNKLRHFVDIQLKDGTKSTIFEMLENFNDKYYKEEHYVDWLDYFIDLFFFLIYNDDYSEHGLYKDKDRLIDKDCDPIYPYLVTYYRENVDRDNLKKCTYRVPVPTGGVDKDFNEQGFIINILTEKDYMPQPYFCMPLKYGVSENWWINPFLMPRAFVRRMEGMIKEGKVKL